MGANCCVAARIKDLPQRRGPSTHRNVRHSPSWSFQWNNQTYAEDIAEDLARVSHVNRRSFGVETKHSIDVETESLSGGGTDGDSFGSPNWHKTPTHVGTTGTFQGSQMASNHLPPESMSIGVDSFSEGLTPMKSSYSGTLRKSKVSTPITASSAFRGETSSSQFCHRHSLPPDATSSRKTCSSPACPFSRQTSDRHLTTFRSLNEKNFADGRRSNALSISNTDLSAAESVGGSSDSWSLRLFSELVASSQRERWSFGYENMSSNHGKATRSNSRQVVSPPPVDSQSCGVCSKLLKDRSWASQKISNFELSVVSVLVCGHVYHAECLESVTSEADRFDPSCPICAGGEKSASKLLGKGKGDIKGRNKISRNAVADVDLDGVPISKQQTRTILEPKDSKLGSSSSFMNLGRPFLRRHFSIGSRPARSVLDNEVTRKNFWGRHRGTE